jgi:hypothetical protein
MRGSVRRTQPQPETPGGAEPLYRYADLIKPGERSSQKLSVDSAKIRFTSINQRRMS